MIELVKKDILKQELISENAKVLVAVSGGIDSVVLFQVLRNLGYDLSIAHCNFQLREEDSNLDEEFVKKLAKKNNVQFYVKRFELSGIKGSIQEIARDLRYGWFEEIKNANGYTVIAVGHHKEDSTETFLINLIRGTGISGLRGIKAKMDSVVRPLINCSRLQIKEYAERNKIQYRHDKSNNDTKYLRNKIRHEVLPMLNELNPRFNKGILDTMGNLFEVEKMYKENCRKIWDAATAIKNDTVSVEISVLENCGYAKLVLLEGLRSYGFNSFVVEDIVDSLSKGSGKKFYSSTHLLVKDRAMLLISPIKKLYKERKELLIQFDDNVINEPISLRISKKSADKFKLIASSSSAALDDNKLAYPLLLRKWKEGDWFVPLGMKNKKKLSDFFIDNKVTLLEKEKIFVLESNGDIIWVVGFRIDNRYKLTEKTKMVCTFELEDGAKR